MHAPLDIKSPVRCFQRYRRGSTRPRSEEHGLRTKKQVRQSVTEAAVNGIDLSFLLVKLVRRMRVVARPAAALLIVLGAVGNGQAQLCNSAARYDLSSPGLVDGSW